jgi:saccharopine dehydrogenase (NADP+, L-glutamate forming)
LTLWNRTLSKAQALLDDLDTSSANASQLDWDQLAEQVAPGDVLVSMLPAVMHEIVAELCLDRQAHFVSSSYIAPAMRQLSPRAEAAGLCFVNESGLDPGIDHLMAHALVADYRSSPQFDKSHAHYFRSFCGGLSKHVNDFRYKFSWSPLGVLRALISQSRWIENGATQTADRPWHALTKYAARLPAGDTETFEAFPNRDSVPYRSEYRFDDDWNVAQFVRGTLRYDGWSCAWQEIFELVETHAGPTRDEALASKSDELWDQHRYEEGEVDRVVLCVELEVRDQDRTIWHQAYSLDESGNHRGSAMARLVSLPASMAVDSIVEGKIEPGVSGAPRQKHVVDNWMSQLAELGERVEKIVVV